MGWINQETRTLRRTSLPGTQHLRSNMPDLGEKMGPLGWGWSLFSPSGPQSPLLAGLVFAPGERDGESGRGQDNLVRKTGLALVILGTEAPLSRFA